MTFTRNIPISGDSLGGTRDRVRTNFQEIDTVNSVNHVAFNSLGEGKHKFLQMPVQASSPVTAADEAGLFALDDSSGVPQLYFKGDNTAAAATSNLYQLTAGTSGADANIATFGANANGWTFLPGGLLLQWGSYSQGTSTAGISVSFSRAFGAAPYSIVLTFNRNSGTDASVMVKSLTASSFTGRSTASGSHTAYYQAIGSV